MVKKKIILWKRKNVKNAACPYRKKRTVVLARIQSVAIAVVVDQTANAVAVINKKRTRLAVDKK
ncbi:hypothetical protein ACFL06_02075 [Patescibacteria group bacterium]